MFVALAAVMPLQAAGECVSLPLKTDKKYAG